MDTLRILIIASDPLARAGLGLMLERQPGCQVVGQTAGMQDLPSALELYLPDVCLVDLGINFDLRPGAFDLKVNLPLVYLLPGGSLRDLQAIVLAGWSEARHLEAAQTGSASIPRGPGRAFLGREAGAQSIAHAFFSVADGLWLVDPGIGENPRLENGESPSIEDTSQRLEKRESLSDASRRATLDSRSQTLDARTYEALTPRELEVLGLIAEGMANKRIAQNLGISEHTVKYHINTILGKLGAESRTEAVTRAARLGWLTL